ncbi:MAG: hypothetical protein ACTSRW_04445 [Candidatus Helarchaeota archaeon]
MRAKVITVMIILLAIICLSIGLTLQQPLQIIILVHAFKIG